MPFPAAPWCLPKSSARLKKTIDKSKLVILLILKPACICRFIHQLSHPLSPGVSANTLHGLPLRPCSCLPTLPRAHRSTHHSTGTLTTSQLEEELQVLLGQPVESVDVHPHSALEQQVLLLLCRCVRTGACVRCARIGGSVSRRIPTSFIRQRTRYAQVPLQGGARAMEPDTAETREPRHAQAF